MKTKLTAPPVGSVPQGCALSRSRRRTARLYSCSAPSLIIRAHSGPPRYWAQTSRDGYKDYATPRKAVQRGPRRLAKRSNNVETGITTMMVMTGSMPES
ncbi:hypothetical protein M378DRAFT_169945 [Amanita muscaria Koide BX008]|uniref:Uncharacterized protein n=1 Tax=Amanita muscaria (strain Koide BX008) TaxID=946122 RepID=A0A0C2WQH3_AMAMK|nr:hypothetical protein M378DRAFT_169945 [Amanita muscaria Koide BX008]